MRLSLRPAHALIFTAVAATAWPATSSAQIIRELGREIRQAENNGAGQQAVPAQGTTVNQRVQPVQGTIVATSPVTTVTTTSTTSTIGSHQIDRFEAIRQLQSDVKSDPNNLANWAILGELAHEVALDLPEGQDDAYYKLSREAYEKAAQLDPNNMGLRSAVQFAREQEANAARFDAQRRQGVNTYLEARRREMTVNGVNPTVMVYESTPTVSTPAAQPVGAATPTYANTAYPTPTYRPYYNTQAQQPYSYNQYANGYTPLSGVGGQTVAPTTLRQYGQQLPGVLMNQGVRSFGTGTLVPR